MDPCIHDLDTRRR